MLVDERQLCFLGRLLTGCDQLSVVVEIRVEGSSCGSCALGLGPLSSFAAPFSDLVACKAASFLGQLGDNNNLVCIVSSVEGITGMLIRDVCICFCALKETSRIAVLFLVGPF